MSPKMHWQMGIFSSCSLQDTSNDNMNIIQCIAGLWRIFSFPDVLLPTFIISVTVFSKSPSRPLRFTWRLIFIYFRSFIYRGFCPFIIRDELKYRWIKYTRSQKKDGNGEITPSFNTFLKETDKTEEVKDCLRHWIRQLDEVEQLESWV